MPVIGRWTSLVWTSVLLLKGGVIGGVVLEQQSGIPLARAKVRLDRVDLSGRVQSDSLIAGRSGQFTFSNVPDGLYVLTAVRDGYAPIAFGQRRPHGTGPAFALNCGERDARRRRPEWSCSRGACTLSRALMPRPPKMP